MIFKKIIFVPSFLLLVLASYGQSVGLFTYAVVRDSLCIGDSCVKFLYGDSLVSADFLRETLATFVADSAEYADTAGYSFKTRYSEDTTFVAIDLKYIDFDTNYTTPTSPAYRKGRKYYNSTTGSFVSYVNDPEVSLNEGQELYIYGQNATNTTLTNGTVLWIDSCSTCAFPVFRRAIADNPEIAAATIAVATHDIEPGTFGYGTRFGGVGIDATGLDDNVLLYVSPVDSGRLVNYSPKMPFYKVRVGRVIKTGAQGTLGVDVEPFTGNDTQVAADGILNGIILDNQSLRDTVIGGILYFETNNQTNDTIDLPFMYENEIHLLNTTSGAGKDGRARVALTWGTATNATTNYIYIDNSGANPVLAANTTGFPANGVRLAQASAFNQTVHEAQGFATMQRFNNSVNGSPAAGWISRAAKRIRVDGSKYESGIDPTVTIITSAGVDSLQVSTTSGVQYQFNQQTFGAQNGKRYLWANDPAVPGGMTWITDLNQITVDANNNTLRLNNTRYGLNLFSVQNSGDYESFILVMTPNGSYSSDANAIADVNSYAISTPPTQFRKVATRLFRIVVNYSTSAGGTFTNLLGSGGYQDERGFPLGTAGGGGGSGGALTNFSDADFYVYNSADPTKIADFDISALTTGVTRTLTMADENVDLRKRVDTTGTSATTQVALFSSPRTIEGDANFTYAADVLNVDEDEGGSYFNLDLKPDRPTLDIYLQDTANGFSSYGSYTFDSRAMYLGYYKDGDSTQYSQYGGNTAGAEPYAWFKTEFARTNYGASGIQNAPYLDEATSFIPGLSLYYDSAFSGGTIDKGITYLQIWKDGVTATHNGVEVLNINEDKLNIYKGVEVATTSETFAATKTIDFSSQYDVEYTVTGNTDITVTNIPEGVSPKLALIYSGNYTVTLAGATQMGGNTATFQNVNGAIDLIQFDEINGTQYYAIMNVNIP